MPTTVYFNTTAYERAWARSPRGQGYWAFFAKGRDEADLFWVNGTYTEAKRKARAYFAAKYPAAGSVDVVVCS